MNQVTSFVNTVLDRFRHYMDEEGRNHVFKSWLKRRSEIRGMTRRVYFIVFPPLDVFGKVGQFCNAVYTLYIVTSCNR